MTNISEITPGDRVTYLDRFGKERTGTATIINRKADVVVLNMGGRYGTPACAGPDQIVKVRKGRAPHGAGAFIIR